MPESSNEIQSATASINNEDQNTQKEAHIPGGNEKENDELVIEIRENEKENDGLVIEIRRMVEWPESQSSKECLIHKVLPQLRKWNEEAYTPQIISIGPIHHKNKSLKAMEEHKQRIFRNFMKRSKIELKYLVGTIREMEERIRGCYAEKIGLCSDMFVKMILVDASFILEILLGSTLEGPLVGGLGELPRATAVTFDLLLLENQLPFFVIVKLHQLAYPSDSASSNYDALLKHSINYFSNFFYFQIRDDLFNVKIDHFTDLLRAVQLPPLEKRRDRCILNDLSDLSYSATQLHEAGVKFEVVTGECPFDVKFEKGVLKMSQLVLNNWTEVVTRNIMALEQISYIEDTYFADYFFLMDSLINTRKDVDFLCEKKILVNCLDDSNAANSMINNLNKGIIWVAVGDDYSKLCKELNSFYEQRPWCRWMAVLKRDFFSTPSAAASTIITIVVITVLTLIQTVCSILEVTDSS